LLARYPPTGWPHALTPLPPDFYRNLQPSLQPIRSDELQGRQNNAIPDEDLSFSNDPIL